MAMKSPAEVEDQELAFAAGPSADILLGEVTSSNSEELVGSDVTLLENQSYRQYAGYIPSWDGISSMILNLLDVLVRTIHGHIVSLIW